MSFDTVVFKKPFEPLDAAIWRDAGFSQTKHGRLARNDDCANMTVYQKGHQGKDWLLVQASLPKIVFGHNATLVNEKQAREAASWLCGHVSSETGLGFPLDDVRPFRVDYTRDYGIQDDRAREIALSLVSRDLPGYSRVIRCEDSIVFQIERDGRTIREIAIYPKFRWAIDTNQPPHVIDASRGKLRLEVRLKRKGLSAIKGAIKPLDYLKQSVSDGVLNETANLLNLQRIIDTRKIDFHESLIVHSRGQGSLGKLGLPTFLELVKRHGEHFNRKPDFYYPNSTYHKRKAELKELGIWDDLVAASQVNRS